MSDAGSRLLSQRRYVHLLVRDAAEPGKKVIVVGLAPAAAAAEVRYIELKEEDWPALADQLDAAAAVLRTHAANGGN